MAIARTQMPVIIDLGESDDEDVPVRSSGAHVDDPVVLSDSDDGGTDHPPDKRHKASNQIDHAPTQSNACTPIRDCPVCMDALGSNGAARALGCVHVYCEPCIRQHIVTQLKALRTPTCPICKRDIPPEEQRACGVNPREVTGGFAYGPAVDMFAPDDEPLGVIASQRQALSAAFPHASARDVRRQHNQDPMLLLDRHMVHQRRDNGSAPRQRAARGGNASGPADSGEQHSSEQRLQGRRWTWSGSRLHARAPVSWP